MSAGVLVVQTMRGTTICSTGSALDKLQPWKQAQDVQGFAGLLPLAIAPRTLHHPQAPTTLEPPALAPLLGHLVEGDVLDLLVQPQAQLRHVAQQALHHDATHHVIPQHSTCAHHITPRHTTPHSKANRVKLPNKDAGVV